jgi:hypothetical protein
MKILPKDFQSLLVDEKEMWSRAQQCLDNLNEKFNLSKAFKPQLGNFESIVSKSKPRYFQSWKVHNEISHFTLCLVQYDFMYTTVGLYKSYQHYDKSLYLFGHIKLIKSFGTSFIRPETLHDNITEIINPKEIDFKDYPKFCNKYYVLSEDEQILKKALTPKFLQFMSKIKGLQIEFRNHQCLFRLPKSVDLIESQQLCRIGLKLNEILNEK